MMKLGNKIFSKEIKEGQGESDFYVDEGLLKKLEAKWEEPNEEEIDVLYNSRNNKEV